MRMPSPRPLVTKTLPTETHPRGREATKVNAFHSMPADTRTPNAPPRPPVALHPGETPAGGPGQQGARQPPPRSQGASTSLDGEHALRLRNRKITLECKK